MSTNLLLISSSETYDFSSVICRYIFIERVRLLTSYTALLLTILFFWVVTPYGLVGHNPEENHLHRRENLKSHTALLFIKSISLCVNKLKFATYLTMVVLHELYIAL
jgi:hypothetical protein